MSEVTRANGIDTTNFRAFSEGRRKAEQMLTTDPRAAKLPSAIRALVIDSAAKASTLPATDLVQASLHADARLNGTKPQGVTLVSFIGMKRFALRDEGRAQAEVDQETEQLFRGALARRLVLTKGNETTVTMLQVAGELAQEIALDLLKNK